MRARAWWIAAGFVLGLAAVGCGDDAGPAVDSRAARHDPSEGGGAAGVRGADVGDGGAGESDDSAGSVTPSNTDAPRDGANVFMSGHSIFNLVVPAMFHQMAVALGQEHRYNVQIGNGSSLRVRYLEDGNYQQRDGMPISFSMRQEIPNAQTIGAGQRYDTLIITEIVPIIEQIAWNDSVGYTVRFHTLLMQSDPHGQVYLFDVWEHVCEAMSGCVESDFPAWIEGTHARYVMWECIAAMANRALEVQGPRVRLLPASLAFARLADEVLNGTVPGIASPTELFEDALHPNDLGKYYLALVLYAAVYHRDPASAPTEFTTPLGRKSGFVSLETAARMQQLAREVVTEFYADEASHERTPAECREAVAPFCDNAACTQKITDAFAD